VLVGFLDTPPQGDTLVLIEAGDLDKRSKLRALCEGGTPLAVAVPCYLEDAVQRVRTLASLLEAEGMKAARDTLVYLADVLPADRLAVRREIEKLALYARGKNVITLDDARAALQDASAAETDNLVHAVANGDVKRAVILIDNLLNEQTSPVALLRAAQRHFLRLHLARSYADSGLSAKAAIEKLQPKVFWKHVEPMARQVQRWPVVALERFLGALYEAEADVKQTGMPDATLTSRLLIQAAGWANKA
jgi:DNA polymerase-3 subunit delta